VWRELQLDDVIANFCWIICVNRKVSGAKRDECGDIVRAQICDGVLNRVDTKVWSKRYLWIRHLNCSLPDVVSVVSDLRSCHFESSDDAVRNEHIKELIMRNRVVGQHHPKTELDWAVGVRRE